MFPTTIILWYIIYFYVLVYLYVTLVPITITMKSTITTAFVFAALAATLMMFAASVIIQQVDAAPPNRAILCNSHSPNGGISGPPCGPLRAR
jgi:hypothetical protein